jgi:3-hydroxybutyryl-CoA dehydrogenase
MEIKKIGILGAGTMGTGIAQVFAQAGYEVAIIDIKQEIIDKCLKNIAFSLGKFVEKQKIKPEEKDATLQRIHASLTHTDLEHVGFLIEAVTEEVNLKKQVLRQLDTICEHDTIFATNTSSISITHLASVTRHPEQFIGMHFMNPVPLMKLVEIIRGLATSQTTAHVTFELVGKLGKTPVEVNDYPGFAANRILMPMINEAIFALMEGVATKEAIDDVMRLGMNHPLGPLALADLIGLDICLAIMNVLHEGFGDTKYRPCPLLKNMVAAGHLGKKTGRGFYTY